MQVLSEARARVIVQGMAEVQTTTYAKARNEGLDAHSSRNAVTRATLAWRQGQGLSEGDLRLAITMDSNRLRREVDRQMEGDLVGDKVA